VQEEGGKWGGEEKDKRRVFLKAWVVNEISNRDCFCWLLTSLCFQAEVGRDAVWEKRCILYNLKLLFSPEETTRDLQVPCFLLLCYYCSFSKENRAERNKTRDLFCQLGCYRLCLFFSFTKTCALANTHKQRRAHLHRSVHAYKEPFLCESSDCKWRLISLLALDNKCRAVLREQSMFWQV